MALLSEALNQEDEEKNLVLAELFNKLFETKNSSLILTITDLDKRDLEWATALELLYSLIVEPYIQNNKLKEQLYGLKNNIYLLRISKERKGRSESVSIFTEEMRQKMLNGFNLPQIK